MGSKNGKSYKFGSPMNKILTLCRIPNGFRCPDHTGRVILYHYQSLVDPVDQIGTFPNENTLGALALCGVPCCLFARRSSVNSFFQPLLSLALIERTFAISRSVPIIYHFFPASLPPPGMIVGSRTPPVPLVGLKIGDPLFKALNEMGLLPLLR